MGQFPRRASCPSVALFWSLLWKITGAVHLVKTACCGLPRQLYGRTGMVHIARFRTTPKNGTVAVRGYLLPLNYRVVWFSRRVLVQCHPGWAKF